MAVDGIVVVDKPGSWTSHDVVAKIRRLAHTRRVGHAGTLDPMATGVLVLGVERATRLLGHLALTEKAYDATIRLGRSTHTDDATGEVTGTASATHVTREDIELGIEGLSGEIQQVPSAVSAVKVSGERAYRRARAGEEVELQPRTVQVHEFTLHRMRRVGAMIDLDVTVVCSSGTYVRALARDLGARLGVGGHLTALRRTRVGVFSLDQAKTVAELEREFSLLPISDVASASFPRYDVDQKTARLVAYGQKLPEVQVGGSLVGMFAPDGRFLALYEDTEAGAKPVAVFAG